MVMTKQNDFYSYIEARLEDWAEWHLKSCGSGLGYPRKNILAQLRDNGGLIIRGVGRKVPNSNLAAEEVEMMLSKLHQQMPQLVEVIRVHYLNPYNHESKAIEKGYSRSLYYSYLRLAREWVRGYLSVRSCEWS